MSEIQALSRNTWILVLYQTYCRRGRLFTNPAVAKRKDIVCVIEVRFSRLRDKEDSETAYKQNF